MSGGNGNHWFLQPPGKGADHNDQAPSPSLPAPQQGYQPSNATNPFDKVTQSQGGSTYPTPPPGYTQPQYPPSFSQQGLPYPQQQGLPYPPQQGGPFTPPQLPSHQGTPYPQQQGSSYPQQAYPPPQQQVPYPTQPNFYGQSGTFAPPQQGYPQQQGSSYPQQGYPQQGQFSGPNLQAGGEASSFYGPGPPPAILPGPGPGGPDERGFFDNAMQIPGVQQPPPGPDGLERGWFSSSKNPLDPPPKMFKRPAPPHYAYTKFQPMSVLAVTDQLQGGFALIPPVTAPGDLHPFISHDITEEDWHKFLKDFQKTAHLSPSDRLFQGIANSFAKDKIPSAKLQKRMAENKLEPIGDYLMAWNHYFFHPRRISVVLAKGDQRFSGETDDYPPDISHHPKKASKQKKSSHKTRSADFPLATVAEPYPKGSIVGDLFNPLHKAIHDTTMAVATTPQQILLGSQPRSLKKPKSKVRRDSDDSDSSSSSSSSSESGDYSHKHGKTLVKKAERERRRKERKERRAKHGKVKQSVVAAEFPSTRFRLVVCCWDGQQEVY